MHILVLGGTQFAGRHIVEALARDGHAIVRFHRGHTSCPAPPNVSDRFGDRNDDLSSIATDEWDAIVDVNAYEPHQIERAMALHTKRYVFISTCSVYADLSMPGIREDAPVIAETFDDTDAAVRYGGNKAACERLVREHYPNATILRPGLIVGPYDPTDRFTYWCERALRGGAFLAPEPKDQPVQFIDARDIAEFVALALARGIAGTFNMVGPREHLTMEAFIDTLVREAQAFGAEARPRWTDSARLLEENVAPWMELPLWLPLETHAGLLTVDNSAAREAGLTLRPASETIHATMEWTTTLSPDRERKAGMPAEREDALLAL